MRTILMMCVIAASLFAATAKDIVLETRQTLSPIVDSLLQRQCGEDCPSFKVEPRLALPPDEVDELGFSKSESAKSTELRSIQVTVLTADSMSAASQTQLKEILTARLSNETNVPIFVTMKPLPAAVPVKKSAISPTISALQVFNNLGWPFTILLIAGMLFAAWLLTLRNQRKIEEASRETALETETEVTQDDVAATDLQWVKSRYADLAWWIEELVRTKDSVQLSNLLSHFPAEELTSSLSLSKQALQAIADLKGSSQHQPIEQFETQLKEALNRAHWKRTAEDQFPLSQIPALSDAQILAVYRGLATLSEKAALFQFLPKERWPRLLSHLNSTERVSVGLSLNTLEEARPAERKSAEQALAAIVKEIKKEFVTESALLEDFSLYLSEKEGKELWQKLSHTKTHDGPLSVEALVDALDDKALAELCLRLDPRNLKVIYGYSSQAMKQKLLMAMPRQLKERMSGGIYREASRDSDPQWMRARAEILELSRGLRMEGAIQ